MVATAVAQNSIPLGAFSRCAPSSRGQGRVFVSKRMPHRFVQVPRGQPPVMASKDTGEGFSVAGAVKTADKALDSAAGLLPSDIPKPLAKGGVAAAGALVTIWLFKTVFNFVFTIGLIAGGIYVWRKLNENNDGGGGGGSDSRSTKDGDYDDPVAEAQRIMDKYK